MYLARSVVGFVLLSNDDASLKYKLPTLVGRDKTSF